MQKDGRKQIIEVKNRSFSPETFNLVETTRNSKFVKRMSKSRICVFHDKTSTCKLES